ncbi:MAG: hypothetical protein R3B93_29080 [Bacteroidia bacterium]
MKKNWSLVIIFLFISLYAYPQGHIEAAKKYLDKHITKWQLQPSDIQDLVVTDAYQSAHNGAYHVYLGQRFKGIEILDAHAQVHLLKNLNVVRVNQTLIDNLQNRVPL